MTSGGFWPKNEFNSATYGNPKVAELVTAVSGPSHAEFSETQKSMMTATAWHFANIFWSARRSHPVTQANKKGASRAPFFLLGGDGWN
ncbi:MAG: hypothetical protein OEM99_08435 [Gammaproteobacteria bacterium]|nr:hypothetical protein [Gammaproteobacteria bacterium]